MCVYVRVCVCVSVEDRPDNKSIGLQQLMWTLGCVSLLIIKVTVIRHAHHKREFVCRRESECACQFGVCFCVYLLFVFLMCAHVFIFYL